MYTCKHYQKQFYHLHALDAGDCEGRVLVVPMQQRGISAQYRWYMTIVLYRSFKIGFVRGGHRSVWRMVPLFFIDEHLHDGRSAFQGSPRPRLRRWWRGQENVQIPWQRCRPSASHLWRWWAGQCLASSAFCVGKNRSLEWRRSMFLVRIVHRFFDEFCDVTWRWRTWMLICLYTGRL